MLQERLVNVLYQVYSKCMWVSLILGCMLYSLDSTVTMTTSNCQLKRSRTQCLNHVKDRKKSQEKTEKNTKDDIRCVFFLSFSTYFLDKKLPDRMAQKKKPF